MLNRYINLIGAVALLMWIGCSGPSTADSTGEVSIAYLKTQYRGHPITVTADHVIRGRIVSSDRHGNFYKTLVVEDQTGGIEVKANRTGLFRDFRQGDMVEVRCAGLTLGALGGVVQLGSAPQDGYQTGYIPYEKIGDHIVNLGSGEEKPRPAVLSIDGCEARYLSCFVAFDEVWFPEAGEGRAWCEPGEDTERALVDSRGNSLKVRTVSYAGFALQPLPEGKIYIEGILSLSGGEYCLRVIAPSGGIVVRE